MRPLSRLWYNVAWGPTWWESNFGRKFQIPRLQPLDHGTTRYRGFDNWALKASCCFWFLVFGFYKAHLLRTSSYFQTSKLRRHSFKSSHIIIGEEDFHVHMWKSSSPIMICEHLKLCRRNFHTLSHPLKVKWPIWAFGPFQYNKRDTSRNRFFFIEKYCQQ